MRIRKRQVPLPLSSLSPIPLSDPLFFSHDDDLPPVQLRLPPSAKPRLIPPAANDSDPCRGTNRLPKEEDLATDYSPELRDDGKARGVQINHSRAPDNAEKLSASGSSPSAVSASRSHEAYTTAPKKRRLSSSGDVDSDENKMEVKSKASSQGNNGGRRRGRGGGVGGGGARMEGSRCSRVNGRGWRCGQQTLVGYSLCEHHLGKGRLRSMTNVRSRSMIGATEAKLETAHQPTGTDPESSLPLGLKEGHSLVYNNKEEDDDEEEEDSAANGKKKARSMSSLLGQVPNYGDNSCVVTMSSVVEGRDL